MYLVEKVNLIGVYTKPFSHKLGKSRIGSLAYFYYPSSQVQAAVFIKRNNRPRIGVV